LSCLPLRCGPVLIGGLRQMVGVEVACRHDARGVDVRARSTAPLDRLPADRAAERRRTLPPPRGTLRHPRPSPWPSSGRRYQRRGLCGSPVSRHRRPGPTRAPSSRRRGRRGSACRGRAPLSGGGPRSPSARPSRCSSPPPLRKRRAARPGGGRPRTSSRVTPMDPAGTAPASESVPTSASPSAVGGEDLAGGVTVDQPLPRQALLSSRPTAECRCRRARAAG
jgi:hypothetical protein